MNSLNLILFMLIFGVGGFVFFLTFFKKNKFKFRIRLITGTNRLIIDDVGTEIKTDKHVKYLKLKKMKELVPMPPSDSIDLNKRGQKLVEAYRDENGNYSYICDNHKVKFFNPTDTEMQVLFADQVVKANDKHGGWKQNIPILAGLGFVAIVFISFLLLVGEPLNALDEYTGSITNNINEGYDLQNSILDKLIQLEKDIQVLKANEGVQRIENPPN